MRAGIACLILAYVMSQFYRAFLAVLTPMLKADLGLGAEQLSNASGLWFLGFALMQLPIGWALDRIGPRRTVVTLFALGAGGGAAVFATAQGATGINVAMALIGVGCAPVLMSSYYIFARSFPGAMVGTLAGITIGTGSLGNILGSLPLAWAAQTFGWRGCMWGLSALTLAIAAALAVLVRDPPRVIHHEKGSLLDLLRMPQFWPLLVMMFVCYYPVAGLRGLWIGPYFADVYGADQARIGMASLMMALAIVAGNYAYGPLDRIFGTRKWVILGGNLLCAACILALWARPAGGEVFSMAMLAGVGLFGASFPMVLTHGRAFVPPHLMGRGVTLLNFSGIGAVGIAQIVTGRIHAAAPKDPASAPYAAVFLWVAISLLAGLAVYAFAQDRTD
ncbi:MAG: MFS transporter [Paracoccaceae bacterium]